MIIPGQTIYRDFFPTETPTGMLTVRVYQSTEAGVYAEITEATHPGLNADTTLVTTGHYYASMTVPAAALHGTEYRLVVSDDNGVMGAVHGGWVDLKPHGLTAGQAGQLDAIEDKANLIGTGAVTVASPVDGESNITVRRSRDYNNTDGLAIEFANPDGTWPDLTNATIALLVARPGRVEALYSFSGTVVTPTGANQTVRVELTAAQLAIDANDYAAEVVATLAPSGRKVTLAEGTLNVILGREAPV